MNAPSYNVTVLFWPDGSRLKEKFEGHEIECLLLGDLGYSCFRYLMTPLQNSATAAERNYNRSQKKTR